jgi:eukaryotic-like serine/threonine-protein kinase
MNFGRYEIVKEVGRGAMGVVYQAHDPQIDRMVALKVLRPDRVTSEDLAKRFLKEAKAIGRLSHPNIVTVYDVGHDHDTIYIAMEYLEGSPLNDLIANEKPGLDGIVDLGVQMAEAVDYAHQKGIVHRDIKPTNIIVTSAGQVKITDFGIARIEDPTAPQQTLAGEILGTPAYMSPEQVMGKTVDGRSDLYSLGVILYELCAGKRPFGGDSLAAIFRAITQDDPVDPATANPGMSPALSLLILKSLDKDPDRRFQTGKALSQALKVCIVKDKTMVMPPAPDEKKSRRTGWVLSIALVVAALGGAFYYFSPEPQQASKQSGETVDGSVAQKNTAPVGAVGLLKVESSPPGAQVFVGGAFKGKSPIDLDLPAGKHEVRLNLPNYYEWEAQLQLREERETPLFVRLIPME